ncbi:3-hydroxybutyryl-CoA dehydrogenase [Novibacillus thermophilus]|uniref:3-hydroxybutyryl-CoA dehydrogenase n=1 Tax=Novibacillus thermophilus TaxID=1471761 RepID=A0A1U9KB06_9BACL|nr:3-hydroxybutyryl-CoA dehydrogenase [Novibacillus thermophilus]AQS57220.1 3-hydroxybutyryl-CoA dehydrogenase [Novibacillus thermophilus]
MPIETIMVVGAGQMGSGIAQVAAQSGHSVILHDIKAELAERGRAAIEQRLSRYVEKEKMSGEEKAGVLSRLRLSTELEHVRQADIVIEAVTEKMEVKADLFRRLDEMAPTEVILASNTSSLPITEIAAETGRPDRVIGMHFMNPVPVMKLVEIIRGLATSDGVSREVENLARAMGKTPVEVKDFPGFVSNRVLMPMINEAIYTVYEGVATPEAVDEVMKLGMHHPMGPIQLADFIGLDTCLYIMETLYEGFGDPKYRPCPLLRQYVKAGWLGRKTGRGFYAYD